MGRNLEIFRTVRLDAKAGRPERASLFALFEPAPIGRITGSADGLVIPASRRVPRARRFPRRCDESVSGVDDPSRAFVVSRCGPGRSSRLAEHTMGHDGGAGQGRDPNRWPPGAATATAVSEEGRLPGPADR